MTVHPTLFTEIFALWPNEFQAMRIGSDMGVPRGRAQQWINRDYIPPWYWPRLVDVVEQRFGRVITYRQLVEASVSLRGQAQIDAQAKAAEARRRNKTEAA